MNYLRRFKSYVNLGATEAKAKRILAEFEFATCADYMTDDSLSRSGELAASTIGTH